MSQNWATFSKLAAYSLALFVSGLGAFFAVQRHGNAALRYEVTQVEGADHARDYEVAAFLNDRALGSGRGPSKKLAEEAAARAALETLKREQRGES